MKSALIASSIILGASLSFGAMAEDELEQEDLDKILEALSGIGCTEIQGEGEDEGTHFEVDDVICDGHSYDIQMDKEMKIITMVRDPSS